MTTKETVLICFLLAALIILASSCSTSNRREQLQAEHPDCHVFEDLAIECPNPFDSSAGFGTSVINQKIKKRTKKNESNTTNAN